MILQLYVMRRINRIVNLQKKPRVDDILLKYVRRGIMPWGFHFIVLASLLCICLRCAENNKSKRERRSGLCIVLTRRQCKLKAKRTRCLRIVPFGEDRHSLRTRPESSSNLSFFTSIVSQSVMQVSIPGKFLRRTWDECSQQQRGQPWFSYQRTARLRLIGCFGT